MPFRRLALLVAALLAVAASPALSQSAAEQAEITAAAADAGGVPPIGNGVGLACPIGTVETNFYFSDFEADDGGWSGSGAGAWEWGAPILGVFEGCDTVPEDEPAGPFSGSNVWATNLNGCYANAGAESLLSQTFDFSALAPPIQLSWWNWYEVFVTFDMGEVLVNDALVFEVTTTAPTGVYVEQTADLSALAGNAAVTIDFRLFATTVVNRAGWYVDDVAITYCAAADADVAIAKVADAATVAPGDPVTYTLTASNAGPGDATGVTVTDTLPAGVTYLSNDCGASFVDPTVTWNIGPLANGASAICNVSVTVDADAVGNLVNAATVVADNSDPNATNNSDGATISVLGGPGVLEIPTAGGWGLAALALLIAAAAALTLRQR